MTMYVYKYGPIEISSENKWTKIMLPDWAEIVHFGAQNGKLYFWAEISDEAPLNEVEFIAIGTGWELPPGAEFHRGTCQVDGFVWHLYERTVL